MGTTSTIGARRLGRAFLPLIASTAIAIPAYSASSSQTCDVTGDGFVSDLDLVAFLQAVIDPQHWLSTSGQSQTHLVAVADFTGDGLVTSEDVPGFLVEYALRTSQTSLAVSPTSSTLHNGTFGVLGLGDPPCEHDYILLRAVNS